MKKIVTISRELGSGGRFIGETLAKELGFTFYDKEIIEQVAKGETVSSWADVPIIFCGIEIMF